MNDDELRQRMSAADPASTLPPGDPAGVARLVEDVMSTELTTENRETGTRERSRLTWVVAAAAVLVIAGAGFFGVRALTGDDPTSDPVATEPASVELAVSDTAGSGKCMVPTPEALAQAQVAFDGTVTSIEGDTVVLEPTTWYAGGPATSVVLDAPSEQMQRVASGVAFEVGGRYLVSAVGGHVTLCGFSAPYSPELAAVYEQAFG
ncbi:hypothetical protein GON03_08800 [Nocardioides sp. MAH-18]|uniref:Uncharacterized protein n=1 Tax=Nocardioides agri TaxID=2682843 RepID=A0A6L6XQ58_9ACTN|nr:MULTISPECIES: hypothetical protein [unclassified Nocardioides]MBA2954419.1 hypothetical protein [Nocardioides sp. CGMCC 1.13656]MVQ49280.1 hypothetical protein [Nocardioides sp. MAH-18]